MNHPAEHDLLVLAPWWKWGAPPDPQQGRASAPVLQKYDSSDLVNTFIQDPQRALKFGPADVVHVVAAAPPAPAGPRPVRFSDTIYVPEEPQTRKIFLDTHKRFYLVVCQISCDVPGLPKVSRDKICQVRFVVRRRTTKVPTAHVAEARQALTDLATARAQRRKLESAWTALRASADAGAAASARALRLDAAKRASIQSRRDSVKARVSSERERLLGLVQKLGISMRLEGWFPSATGGYKIGFWNTVEETPTDLENEDTYPMYPLIPPRSAPEHAGQFGTIYFGLLPTGSHDTDDTGEPRFDDQSMYEVRCYVKRHLKPHGPEEPCPCPDGIFWSLPTEPYRLAPHFDLVGTGQRPVTIQLPSLGDLQAQAAPTLGARFLKPPKSLMVQGKSDGTLDTHSQSSVPEICFIPIPLITIVAMFVFELFLPVLMLVFGLFWMLKLKFCIPPSIDVAAGLTAELSVDASVSASLAAGISANIDASFGSGSAMAAGLKAGFSPIALGNLAFDAKAAGDAVQGLPGTTGTSAAAGVSLTAGLEWETEVTFP